MSIDFGKGDILFEQRLLACGGFYTGKLDGKWGPMSRQVADDARVQFEMMRSQYQICDPRSEANIATLLPKMQIKARQIVALGRAREAGTGLHIVILSGSRTYAEQDQLFSQRPKVTNARGGQSNHNFGIAIDIGIFNAAGKYFTGATRLEEKAYYDFAQAVKQNVPGVDWGGDWKSIVDTPHYEYHTGLTIAQKRKLFEAGKLVLT